MKRNRFLTNKYLLLAVVLIAMLALSGCRTRITNNSEVSNVKYDEDGFLTETYQMRRDELGLSIAEKPLLPDLGSPEDEEESSEPEIEENLNVVQEEDTYVEPPTTTEARNNANRTTTTTTRRTSRRDSDDDEEKVTIFFDANKGKIDGKEVLSVEVKKGSTYNTPPTPTREGYNGIIGWYTEEEEGKGNKVTFPYKAEDDVFLYAHWGDVSVTFNAAGGRINGKDTEVISLKKGSPLKYPKHEPKLENNEFKGWFTASNSGTVVKEGTVINESTTLYAHWEGTNNEVTITFHGNGGTIGGETMVTHTVKPGEKVPVPAKDTLSHPEGKEFIGWNPAIGNETEVVAESTKTYNAQWKDPAPKPQPPDPKPDPEPDPKPDPETKYTVTFEDGFGNVLQQTDVEEGQAATAPDDPSRDGYKFLGWDKEFSNITSSLTVTATWEGKNDYDYWNSEFKIHRKKINTKPKVFVAGVSDSKLVQECVAEADTAETALGTADYVVVFVNNAEEAQTELAKLEYGDAKENGKLLIISKYAVGVENKLVHMITITNWLHDNDEGYEPLDEAASQGDLEQTDQIKIYYPDTEG